MKNILSIIVLLASIIIAPTASAKGPILDTSKPEKPLTFGIRAGLNSSGMRNNYLSQMPGTIQSNFYWRMGGQIGGVVDLHIRKFLAIETGVFWEFRSYDTSMMSADTDEDYMGSMFNHAKANYLNIPIMGSFRLNILPQAQWHIDLGVYYAYGLCGKHDRQQYYAFSDIDSELIFDQQQSNPDYFGAESKDFLAVNRADFGLRMGTGFTFADRYFIGVYYQRGLRNIAKNSEGSPKIKLHNLNWSVSLGYNF